MRNYEVLFILDPVMDDAARNAAVDKVVAIINENGEAGDPDLWGKRRLAYEVNRKTEGFYVLIQFKAEPELPKELDRRLKISDDVMRHIIVCQDKK